MSILLVREIHAAFKYPYAESHFKNATQGERKKNKVFTVHYNKSQISGSIFRIENKHLDCNCFTLIKDVRPKLKQLV